MWALLLQGCFYISAEEYAARWDLDGDGVERPTDCDDGDASVQVPRWYVDADGDGVGGAMFVDACTQPLGTSARDGDCDDADPIRAPGQLERCNGLDDDCDGLVDEGAEPSTWYPDSDDDGHGDPLAPVTACDPPPGHLPTANDCDDTDPDVHPGALEVACNGLDDDCDDAIDLDDDDVDTAPFTWTLDTDGDTWGGTSGPPVIACTPPDGYGPPGDCDDDLVHVNPGAAEVCTVLGEPPDDENCDGATDQNAVDALPWFHDGDCDTFGDPTDVVYACVNPAGFVPTGGDCDDADAGAHPAATERCGDGRDNDCDDFVDEQACVPTDTAAPEDTGWCP